ncbi:family 43 glycosylhydrolase [Saccharopolyspora griseoalba]|uniref:Family 43 glycosylhydrolase n=1 Tax=Saccharopolyspora griseoalba TaxID=1431848 RepID=A0ABW2LQK6_9PSEU
MVGDGPAKRSGAMGRRGVLSGILLAGAALAAGGPAAAAEYANPIARRRADPHVLRHSDGYYYFTATVPESDRIVLRRSTTLQGLRTAREHVLWRSHDSGELSSQIFAPEIHRVDGRWYVYFAAGDGGDLWRIRMYALVNSSPDPLSGRWVERGPIDTGWSSFSLDATTFAHRGIRYLVWAQHDRRIDSNTNIYLAPLADPLTPAAPAVLLSQPTFEWERRGHAVNEAPAVIVRNGRVLLTYSASATDANYCLGLLTAPAEADLMDPASWEKSTEPVFASSELTSQYGPGHNSFTVAEDGSSDVLVYHARPYEQVEGDPLLDPNRHTRIQRLRWNPDGTPDFGIPAAD